MKTPWQAPAGSRETPAQSHRNRRRTRDNRGSSRHARPMRCAGAARRAPPPAAGRSDQGGPAAARPRARDTQGWPAGPSPRGDERECANLEQPDSGTAAGAPKHAGLIRWDRVCSKRGSSFAPEPSADVTSPAESNEERQHKEASETSLCPSPCVDQWIDDLARDLNLHSRQREAADRKGFRKLDATRSSPLPVALRSVTR